MFYIKSQINDLNEKIKLTLEKSKSVNNSK